MQLNPSQHVLHNLKPMNAIYVMYVSVHSLQACISLKELGAHNASVYCAYRRMLTQPYINLPLFKLTHSTNYLCTGRNNIRKTDITLHWGQLYITSTYIKLNCRFQTKLQTFKLNCWLSSYSRTEFSNFDDLTHRYYMGCIEIRKWLVCEKCQS